MPIPPRSPKVPSRFRLLGPLGRGGMAQVFLAYDQELQRDVALKYFPGDVDTDPDLGRRFLLEARTQAAFRHPQIATAFDFLESEDGAFLVLERIKGETLRQRLDSQGPLTWTQIAILAEQVGAAIDALHSRGVIHRDLKPENIMLRDHGPDFVLLDFGLIRDLDTTRLTAENRAVGTVSYIPPEMLQGEPSGPCSDVYQLALVLFEARYNQQWFPNLPKPTDTVATILGRKNEPTFEGCPPPVAEVIRRGAAFTADERPPGGIALARELRAAIEGRPEPPVPRPEARPQANRPPPSPPRDQLPSPSPTAPYSGGARRKLGVTLGALAGLALGYQVSLLAFGSGEVLTDTNLLWRVYQDTLVVEGPTSKLSSATLEVGQEVYQGIPTGTGETRFEAPVLTEGAPLEARLSWPSRESLFRQFKNNGPAVSNSATLGPNGMVALDVRRPVEAAWSTESTDHVLLVPPRATMAAPPPDSWRPALFLREGGVLKTLEIPWDRITRGLDQLPEYPHSETPPTERLVLLRRFSEVAGWAERLSGSDVPREIQRRLLTWLARARTILGSAARQGQIPSPEDVPPGVSGSLFLGNAPWFRSQASRILEFRALSLTDRVTVSDRDPKDEDSNWEMGGPVEYYQAAKLMASRRLALGFTWPIEADQGNTVCFAVETRYLRTGGQFRLTWKQGGVERSALLGRPMTGVVPRSPVAGVPTVWLSLCLAKDLAPPPGAEITLDLRNTQSGGLVRAQIRRARVSWNASP